MLFEVLIAEPNSSGGLARAKSFEGADHVTDRSTVAVVGQSTPIPLTSPCCSSVGEAKTALAQHDIEW